MNQVRNDIAAFILAKDEQDNIGRCLESFRHASWDVIVLDSGSVDETEKIVADFDFAEFRDHEYTSHCDSYNQITTELGTSYKYVLVIDADMIVTEALRLELETLLSIESGVTQVMQAEVLMCVDGKPLPYGSLCPPKPFVFAAGKEYFVSVGHSEMLVSGISVQTLREKIRHDDRKSYGRYLQTQVRYSRNLEIRKLSGNLSVKDRIRTKTALLIFVVPFLSFLVKGGVLSGRLGKIYALDRLIAEAIMYRQSLSNDASK